jgi:hypothetical protein
LLLLGAGQGVFGALSASAKRDLEAAVGDTRAFNAQLATAANVFLNMVLYPIICVALAAGAGRASVFASSAARWVVLGTTLAAAEGMWRLRENLFRGVPLGDAPLRGALYGPVLAPVAAVIRGLSGLHSAASSTGFDGFYGGQEHFDDKLERARRYGEVYRLDERDDAYVFQLEFPRRLPPSSLAVELGLPPEMPDYDFDLTLVDGAFVVHGKVIDPSVRKLTAAAPAFPPAFTTRIALAHRVTGFRHRYTDRTLEVVLPKASDR